MNGLHLDRDDSATIGFVVACLFRQAISVDELRAWADHVLLSARAYPDYITELSLFAGYPKDLFRTIGFVPSSGLTEAQETAVWGIAFARGREPLDPPLTEPAALAALAQHPEVLAEYRATFPFITGG